MMQRRDRHTPHALTGDAPLRAGADEGLEAVACCSARDTSTHMRIIKESIRVGLQIAGTKFTSWRAAMASSLMLSRLANHCEVALPTRVS